MEQRRTHGSQFTKTLRPRSICPSCRRIQCFSRHSLSLPLDWHTFIWEVRLRCNSVFEEEFSSNSSKFPQSQEIFLKLKLLRKINARTHLHCFDRRAQSRPVLIMGCFFLSLNPHDPTAHCNIPMEHTTVYIKRFAAIFSSNSPDFLKLINFPQIHRISRHFAELSVFAVS